MNDPDPEKSGHTFLPVSSILLVVFLALIWGLNWPAIRVAVLEISPWTFRAICLTAGAATLFALALAKGARLRVPRDEILPLIVVALLNVACFHLFTAFGLTMVEAGRGVILTFTFPLWSVLIGALVFRESLSPSRLWALIFGLAALGLLIGPDALSLGAAPLGSLLCVGAALVWAVATVMMKRRTWSLNSAEFAAWQLAIGAVPVVIGALVIDSAPDFGNLSPQGWIALLYTSAIAVAFGQWLWFRILHLLPASIASISTLSIPIVGVFSSALLLGELIGWREGVALLLVLAALFLVLVGRDGFLALRRTLRQRR